jgi:hypothetical protein
MDKFLSGAYDYAMEALKASLDVQTDCPVSQQLKLTVERDIDRFFAQLEKLGFDAEEELVYQLHPYFDGDAWNKVAADFIRTRNGEGMGFWDGSYKKPWDEKLTKLAKSYGECWIDISDNEELFFNPVRLSVDFD